MFVQQGEDGAPGPTGGKGQMGDQRMNARQGRRVSGLEDIKDFHCCQ